MRVLLYILAVLIGFIGFVTEGLATVVTHQILGGVFLIIAAVLFIGAAIVDAIVQLPKRMGVIPPPPK